MKLPSGFSSHHLTQSAAQGAIEKHAVRVGAVLNGNAQAAAYVVSHSNFPTFKAWLIYGKKDTKDVVITYNMENGACATFENDRFLKLTPLGDKIVIKGTELIKKESNYVVFK